MRAFYASLRSRLPVVRVVLELFAGSCRFSRAAALSGCYVCAIDWSFGPGYDLLCPKLQACVLGWVQAGGFAMSSPRGPAERCHGRGTALVGRRPSGLRSILSACLTWGARMLLAFPKATPCSPSLAACSTAFVQRRHKSLARIPGFRGRGSFRLSPRF